MRKILAFSLCIALGSLAGIGIGWATVGNVNLPPLIVWATTATTGSSCNDASAVLQVNNGSGSCVVVNPAAQRIAISGTGGALDLVAGPSATVLGGRLLLGGSTRGDTLKNQVRLESNNGTVYAFIDGDLDSTHHLGSWNLANGEVHAVSSPAHNATIAIAFSDFNKCIDTGTAATEADLPASPDTGRTYTVADCTGHATANPITLTPAAGNIDGSGTFSIAKDWASWSGFYTGTIWKTTAYYPGP